jgi:FtsK/SpoIIIE family
MRQATKEVPRWKQKKAPAPGPVINLSGRQAKALARQWGGALAALPAAPGNVTQAPAARLAARSGAYRYRKHLVPFIWLVLVIGPALIAHQVHVRMLAAVAAAVAGAAVLVLLTRHLNDFARGCSAVLATLAALWLPVLTAFGWTVPWPGLLVLSWLPVAVPWLHRYRWRPGKPEDAPQHDTDVAVWTRLAAKNKWSGHLGARTELPGGGRQYPIILDGAETHIGQVMAEPRKIAAAWGKPITQAYAEPALTGVESRGRLTILPRNTLEAPREWDGSGIDPATGMLTIGRFPDGSPIRIQFFTRRNGVVHSLIAGTTGAGKSYLLSLILCGAAVSPVPVIPIVLDPQEGQSLPEWRRHVLYASGPDECMRYLRGIHAGMLGRSAFLSRLQWTDEDGDERDGCDFYDHEITGLPLILPILDEAPALLTHPKYGAEATYLVADNGKRGRKAGVAEVLAAGVPSLKELGGDQALRDMLAGGNVVGLRTANRVTQGMIGLAADPAHLPKFFASGEKTHGVCYVSGPDNCQAPGRLDIVRKPGKVAAAAVIPPLDTPFAEAMARFLPEAQGKLEDVAAAYQQVAGSPMPLSVVAGDDDVPEGRTASDAIVAVLADAGRDLDRGEIIKRCKRVAEEWGREKPFGVRAIQNALNALVTEGRLDKPRAGSYVLTRPNLTVLAGTAASVTTASQG